MEMFFFFDKDLQLDAFVADGKLFMKEGKILRKGTYEK